MSKRFKTYQKGKALKVVLHNPFKGWGKFTLASYFLSVVVGSWFLIDLVLLDMIRHDHYIFIFFLVSCALLLLSILILSSVMRNVNQYEVLILRGTSLELRKGWGWFKKTNQFNIKEIEDLTLLEDQQKADHPLKTDSFDSLGFQTEQKVIDEFYKSDRITFNYRGKNYSFGKDIMSWEFEELLGILQSELDFNLNQIRTAPLKPLQYST